MDAAPVLSARSRKSASHGRPESQQLNRRDQSIRSRPLWRHGTRERERERGLQTVVVTVQSPEVR
jgi:hypothetical protein